MATSPELAAVIAKVGDGSGLDRREELQYAYFIRSLLYDVQEAYLLHREGRLHAEYWDTRSSIFVTYMQSGAALDVYRRDKALGVLHDAFVGWADQVIAGP